MNTKILFLGICTLLVLFNSCAPFADFQTAKTVGKGNVEITPFYSKYSSTNADIYTFGGNIDYGVTDRIDIRGTYLLALSDISESKSVLGIAPKFNIIKDVFSFTLPYYLCLNGNSYYGTSSSYIEPTLLGTIPINDMIDLTLSPKYIISLDEDLPSSALATNIGVSIRIKNSPITLRPEVGFATQTGSYVELFESNYFHFGLGVSIKLSKSE